MHTYISLLRGINVSGKHTLPMMALKKLYHTIGAEEITTYIQSGNVVFKASGGTATTFAQDISKAIKEEFGYTIQVLVHKTAFFEKIIANNPFKVQDPRTLYVTLLGHEVGPALSKSLANSSQIEEQDRYSLQGSVVYVHCPNGYGKTKLHNGFFEAKTKTWATTRSWRTLGNLVELAMTIG